jgi:hypothetical protein
LLLHLSDHLLDNGDDFVRQVPNGVKSSCLRWDKADLAMYYNATNVYLEQIDSSKYFTNCNVGCFCEHGHDTDAVYNMIVDGLSQAADEHCPKNHCITL